MAIKRCPYCRSITDEREQYCSSCGTQLLFPEDEFIEEESPGEKITGVVEEPAAEKADEELILEEPAPVSSPTSSTFGFPESMTGDTSLFTKDTPPKKVMRDREILEPPAEAPVEEEIPIEIEAESESPAEPEKAGVAFDKTFPSEPAPVIIPPSPKPLSRTRGGLYDTLGQTSLSVSTEEIEDIARIMSSLGKENLEAKETRETKKTRGTMDKDDSRPLRETSSGLGSKPGQTRGFEKDRPEDLRSTRSDRKATSDKLKDSAADFPPWATGMRVEPQSSDKGEAPALEIDLTEDSQNEIPAGLDDFFSSIEKKGETPAASELPVDEEEEAKTPSRSWDIPDREDISLDSLSDRLGRERRESIVSRPRVRQRSGGGSKIMAKILDLVFIAICWAAAVFLATRILSVSISALFDAALLPLLLFLFTLGVAYFFLFLYFLGETLGDRLTSS